MIWNYELSDLNRGYTEEGSVLECAICRKKYEKGRIYETDGGLYDAYGAILQHIRREHGSMAAYLLSQDQDVTGVTQVQQQILKLFLSGKSDKEISNGMGIVQSTVRNHRFNLREKEKQAKLFLALMHSLEQETAHKIENADTGRIEEVPMSAAMVDERYNITDIEREKAVAAHMDENGAVKQFPARAKKKIIILGEIMKNFKKDRTYTETEVNRILKRVYAEDYPGVRRALIEYGFMDRSADCTVYRVKE